MSKTENYKPFYHGFIPIHWDVMALSDMTTLLTNGFVGKAKEHYVETNDGVTYIQGYNILESGFNYNGIKKVSKSFHKKNNKSCLQEGDLLTIQTGEIGLTSIVPKELEGANCHALVISRFKLNIIYPNFYHHYFNSELGRRKFKTIETGSTMKHLNVGDMESLEYPVPPLIEQKSIANILDLMDSAINKNIKLIRQKELHKKWLMQNLLTGKKRLKGFDGEWKEYPYDKLLKIVKRNFDWNENELYKLISVRRRSGGIFYREALYGNQILVKNLRTANEGDFLFSKMQILHGASALVTKEFDGAKISGSYIAVIAKNSQVLNMEFFQWYSQMPYFYHQTYISSYGVHIEKMTFDFETFLQLEMKLPSLQEQKAISHLLNKIDKEIKLLETKSDKIKEQKKGLMQVLLTGKKRLIN